MREHGFDIIGITKPDAVPEAKKRFEEFLADGRYGDMEWLASGPERRVDPKILWPEVRSVLMIGMNYGPEQDPILNLAHRNLANISVYARGDDYHEKIGRAHV